MLNFAILSNVTKGEIQKHILHIKDPTITFFSNTIKELLPMEITRISSKNGKLKYLDLPLTPILQNSSIYFYVRNVLNRICSIMKSFIT